VRPPQDKDFAPNRGLEVAPGFLEAMLDQVEEAGLDVVTLDEAARRLREAGLRILDIGTGSGNIALALAKRLPSARVTAIDVSADALRVAAANAAANGLTDVTFLNEDIMGEGLAGRIFDLVAANPPYVASQEYAAMQPEVRAYEPRGAVTDGAEGFTFHARIAEQARALLRPGGALLVEVGFGQAPGVAGLFERAGLTDIAVRDDYAGIARIVSAIRP